MKNIIGFLFLSLLLSCSKDDNSQSCYDSSVIMKINDELQSFQTIGRGVDLVSGNYKLSIYLYRSSNINSQQNIYFELPYKKIGKNIITKFFYQQNNNGDGFEGDFINGTFQCDVKSNTNKCFYATVSGILNTGSQEIEIKDAIISYTYEEPFDF
ncbi:hypothetical protein [Flavobacterium sp.]|uniref:hypothetical protein n=1 Tax=Flavobacterium sp. TaxID=239 RepID=UPI003753C833